MIRQMPAGTGVSSFARPEALVLPLLHPPKNISCKRVLAPLVKSLSLCAVCRSASFSRTAKIRRENRRSLASTPRLPMHSRRSIACPRKWCTPERRRMRLSCSWWTLSTGSCPVHVHIKLRRRLGATHDEQQVVKLAPPIRRQADDLAIEVPCCHIGRRARVSVQRYGPA